MWMIVYNKYYYVQIIIYHCLQFIDLKMLVKHNCVALGAGRINKQHLHVIF